MKYLKEFKATEIDRWKKFADFGDEGISTDKKAEEIIIVGGFPENVIKGGDDQKPMTDEEIDDLYSAMVDDVKNNEEEEDKDDEQIDDSLKEGFKIKYKRMKYLKTFESTFRPLSYSGGDVTKMPIIGKIITKPVGPFESGEYNVVEIIKDDVDRDIYVVNQWYKEGRVPNIIHSEMVEKFIPGEGGSRKADAELD